MLAAPAPVWWQMLATVHRPSIVAAVGLLAAALARMPRHGAAAPVVPPVIEGCPTGAPALIDSPNLIYISGPDRSNDSKLVFTPEPEPTLR